MKGTRTVTYTFDKVTLDDGTVVPSKKVMFTVDFSNATDEQILDLAVAECRIKYGAQNRPLHAIKAYEQMPKRVTVADLLARSSGITEEAMVTHIATSPLEAQLRMAKAQLEHATDADVRAMLEANIALYERKIAANKPKSA